MGIVHIPRVSGNFGGVVIPRSIFDGVNLGLGVFCGEHHPDIAATERDVRRLAKVHAVAFAGRLELPAGTLLALEMPDDPAKLFTQLGLPREQVRDRANAMTLGDQGDDDVQARWRSFQQLNHRALEGASEARRAALQLQIAEIGINGRGAAVVETPFGRVFADGGVRHAEWQTASDGLRKVQGGRASLFLRAFDRQDWAFIARGLVAQIHRAPERPIGTRELERVMEAAHTPGGPHVGMDELRELIEGEVALLRAQGAVAGRDFAQAVSVGFPPHDPRDRGGVRVKLAQFSTPPAIAEVAAEFLKPEGRTVFEPTIGNGVLAAASYGAGALVLGVEIDEARHGRVVEALPEARVSLGDAMDPQSYPRSPLREDGRYDAVLANPPYGRPEDELKAVRLSDFAMELPASKLETHIATLAIDRLRAGGNAVIVMPAQMMRPSELTVEGKRFHAMLNAVFDRVSAVALDASLYRNMGSNFPVIVYFCEDRREAGAALPVAEAAHAVPETIEVVGTFDAFYEHASRVIAASRIAALPVEEATARRGVFLGAVRADADQVAGVGSPATERVEAENGSAPSAGHGESTGRGSVPRGAGGRATSGPGSGAAQVPGGGPETDPVVAEAGDVPQADVEAVEPERMGADLAAPSRTTPREWFVDDFSPDPFTVPYAPRSRKGTTLAVIERTMANETYTALRRLEDAVGMSVDEYVAGRMGVPVEEFMSDRVLFYPEQVDSLALSFHRRSIGQATIIGDQMGVGKGIQLAAHAYSAIVVDDRPVVFMTNRANLFSDLCIRDWKNASGQRFLDAVGRRQVRPFIFNADGGLRENEKVVFATPPDALKTAQRDLSLGDANLVMMTYSQVQTASGAWRYEAIRKWMSDRAESGQRPVLLLDEAHKAAGETSRTGMVIQDLLAHASRLGVEIVYSSATSLKSGRNLPVYTPALPDTGLSTGELLLAIEKMPLAMQEILASEMARDGALIERKMSDAGVNRELVVLADIDAGKMERTRLLTDRVSSLLRDLAQMGPIIAEAARRQFTQRLGGALLAGSADKVRVETTSIASQLDSFSRYLMGAVKGQFVAEIMQDAVSRGNKPCVVCEYTADSVAEFVIGDQLGLVAQPEGVPVAGHPNVGDVLKRFAHKALVFKGQDGFGNVSELRVQGFDGWLSEFLASVDDADVGELRVNVFDRAREAALAMGQTFEDITGRRYEFREDEAGRVRAYLRERPVTADAVARYNGGQTDVLALNSASATGVSAQASPAHGRDTRPREMIKLAFQREITDERQVEGRVHRAGQIVPPRYTIPVTGFAPDDRIANLFNRANRSLTSSISATRENRTNAEHAVDILNPIGERAAVQVLKRNPMIADMLHIDPEKTEDVARKLLGRSVMLPLAEQSAILSEVDATVRVIADKMTAEGSNPLRLQFYEWDAEVETVEELIPGSPGSKGVAGEPLRLNQVTYHERVESLPAKTVIANMLDLARRRDEPFENMHRAWGYPTLIDRGAINYEHDLFAAITGRREEGLRRLWPMPLPGDVASHLHHLLSRDLIGAEAKLKRPVNGDEFRSLTEELAERLLDPRRGDQVVNRYVGAVTAKFGTDALKPATVAVSLRALWNRTSQVRRLDKLLPLIEPGRLVALDVRALGSATSGLWGGAYQRVDLKEGLVPALITSARFAADAPFAESKMGFSVFVPGNRFTERLTLSTLHSGMEIAGDADALPVRDLSVFLAAIQRRPAGAVSGLHRATQEALSALMSPERLEVLQNRIAELGERYGAGTLTNVVSGGHHVQEAGVALFNALADAMPQQSIRRQRMTLEGNLFAAMSAVSSSVVSATSGEKVVYTDKDGTHRNAILLSNTSTGKLVENVRRKVARRSLVHAGLSSVEAVDAYLRLANAVEHGVGYGDLAGQAEVLAALERFYPAEFGGAAREGASERFAETLAAIRGRMTTQEGTFPSSIMAGGDVWRWATDLAQKAAMQTEAPRGFVAGMGGPVTMQVRQDADPNALGFRDVYVRTTYQPYGLAAALAGVDRSHVLAMSLSQGMVTLVLHKDHPSLGGEQGRALLDRLSQRIGDVALRAGTLAGTFSVVDPTQRGVVARLLVEHGPGKPELLIGGALKEVQKAVQEESGARRLARLGAEVEADRRHDASLAVEPRPMFAKGAAALSGGISGP